MHRPTMTSPLLWIAATLLALQSINLANADMTHHNNRITSTSAASLHKTWGQLIQHESLTASNTEKASSIDGSNTNSVVNRRSHLLLSQVPCFVRRLQLQHHQSLHQKPAIDTKQWSAATENVITKTRGGAASDDHDDEEEYDATDDESSEEEEYDSEYDEEYSDYDDESDQDDEKEEESDNLVSTLTSSSLQSSLRSKSSSKQQQQQQIQQYDEVLTPPAMQQLVISLGVMFLSQRIDIFDTKTVRIARFAFVAYLVTMQLFLLYVRLRAKAVNDRTEIVLSNPLASLVQGAAGAAGGGGGGGGNFMVKALADQMLSSTTTIYEYDLAQAKKMNSGLLMPMVFLYFLHFKMKQVQPLLMQTATGVMNMIYSPLFQVYVLGRNLERPFQSTGNPMMGGATQEEEESGGDDKGVEDDVGVHDGEGEQPEDLEEEEEEEEEEEGSEVEEEESDESEYDSDEE